MSLAIAYKSNAKTWMIISVWKIINSITLYNSKKHFAIDIFLMSRNKLRDTRSKKMINVIRIHEYEGCYVILFSRFEIVNGIHLNLFLNISVVWLNYLYHIFNDLRNNCKRTILFTFLQFTCSCCLEEKFRLLPWDLNGLVQCERDI